MKNILEIMLEILSYDFMQNAIVAGLLVAIASGIMGSFIVVNKLSGLAGGIAHASYGGIGLACFFGFSPLLGSLGFAIVCALLMGFLTYKNRRHADTLISVIWATGMAIGVILTDLTPGYSGDMMSFLFGSILTVPTDLLYIMFFLLLVIICTVSFLFKRLLSISFDPEFALSLGVPVLPLYMVLIILTTFTIVMAVQAVGLILVLALLTLPAFIAETYSKNLFSMILISIGISVFLVLSGLFLAYYLNFVTGPVIILLGVLLYFMHLLIKRFIVR